MSRRVHPAYLVALVAALLAAAAMPVLGHVLQARDAAARQRMRAIATSMQAPRGFVAGASCALRGPGSVGCGHAPGTPQQVAEQARRALAAASAGSPTVSCDRFPAVRHPAGPVRLDCIVRFEDGGHDVLVSVQTRTVPGAGARSPVASDYLVQVS